MIKFGILLFSINNSSRHDVIEQCILLGVEHDERNNFFGPNNDLIWDLVAFSSHQLVGMKPSYRAASLVLSTTSSTNPMVQAPISVGILLLLNEQQLAGNVLLEFDRHEVIVLSWISGWVNARAEPVFGFFLWQSSQR